jgi:hypothetical protein
MNAAIRYVHRTGAVLRTSRCYEFLRESGRKKAAAVFES